MMTVCFCCRYACAALYVSAKCSACDVCDDCVLNFSNRDCRGVEFCCSSNIPLGSPSPRILTPKATRMPNSSWAARAWEVHCKPYQSFGKVLLIPIGPNQKPPRRQAKSSLHPSSATTLLQSALPLSFSRTTKTVVQTSESMPTT
jgi:hypothetical protein